MTKELRERRQRLYEEHKAVLEGAARENRTLTPDELQQVDTREKAIDELTANIEKWERHEALTKMLSESEGRRTEPTDPAVEARTAQRSAAAVRSVQARQEDSIRGLQAWLLAGSDVEITTEQRDIAGRVGLNLDTRRLHLRLPNVALRSLGAGDIRDWESRALSTIVGASGQYTIPDEVMRELEVAMLQFGAMRQVATVLRTDTGGDLPWPTVNDTSNEGEILGDNTQANQQDVAFGQVNFQAYKYSSKMILVPVELLQDNAINLAQFLGRALGERIGRITNRHFTVGTGTNQPYGIVPASTQGPSAASSLNNGITYDELVDFQHTLDPAYRANGARFMFHDKTLAILKKLVDGDGRLIWQMNAAVGAPPTVLGDPYVINQHMAQMGISAKSIVYGDLSKYKIRDVRDVTLLRLDERFAEYHQVAFLAFSRHDGDLIDAGTHPVVHFLNKES